MLKKRKEEKLLAPSTGVLKWVNKFFRFILFPFIHPWWFIISLCVLVAAAVIWPLSQGVEFNNLPEWYKTQSKQYYGQAEKLIQNKLSQYQPDIQPAHIITGQGVNVKAAARPAGKDELVSYETAQKVNRRIFEKAQEVPVDVAATLEHRRAIVAETSETLAQTPPTANDTITFKRIDKLDLSYLEEPKKVVGIAKVLNANEISLNGELIFLYGIYVSPSSVEGISAYKYLEEAIGGKEIECYIGAYTADKTATAICRYNGVNLNQRLVDLKYSRNISLN